MAEETAVDSGQISNFEGLVTLTLNQVILHLVSLIDLYVHAVQISLKSKKRLWTRVRLLWLQYKTDTIKVIRVKSDTINKYTKYITTKYHKTDYK